MDAWQRRYFVLSGGELRYYKTEKAAHTSNGEALKAISLEQVVSASVNPRHPDSLVIDLGQERRVKLQAASEAERDAWVAAVLAAKRKHHAEHKSQNGSAAHHASSTGKSAAPLGTPATDEGKRARAPSDPVSPALIDAELLRTARRPAQGCCLIS